jgi:hypothetical protein
MAGQVNHDGGVRLQVLRFVEKIADDAAQVAGSEITALDDLESCAGQGLCHQTGIVGGSGKLPPLISPLPDHKGEALLLSGGIGGRADNGSQDKSDENDSTFHLRHSSKTFSPVLRALHPDAKVKKLERIMNRATNLPACLL